MSKTCTSGPILIIAKGKLGGLIPPTGADVNCNARFTVPVLWDKKTHTIVNNESSEIIRIFNSAFNDLLPKDKADLNFYPKEHQAEIDELNEWIYDAINSRSYGALHNACADPVQDGVYKAGFASKQEAYQTAVYNVFEGLDKVEKILEGKDYLVGGRLTEADIRLFVTLVSNWVQRFWFCVFLTPSRSDSTLCMWVTSSVTFGPSEEAIRIFIGAWLWL